MQQLNLVLAVPVRVPGPNCVATVPGSAGAFASPSPGRGMTGHEHKHVLVRAAQRGDRRAWDALIAMTTPRLRLVVSRYRLQRADIDDVVQMTWLAAWVHLPRLRDVTAFDGWVARIAEREALRVVHKRDREVTVDELPRDAIPTEAAPEEQVVVQMRATALRGAVGGSRSTNDGSSRRCWTSRRAATARWPAPPTSRSAASARPARDPSRACARTWSCARPSPPNA